MWRNIEPTEIEKKEICDLKFIAQLFGKVNRSKPILVRLGSITTQKGLPAFWGCAHLRYSSSNGPRLLVARVQFGPRLLVAKVKFVPRLLVAMRSFGLRLLVAMSILGHDY